VGLLYTPLEVLGHAAVLPIYKLTIGFKEVMSEIFIKTIKDRLRAPIYGIKKWCLSMDMYREIIRAFPGETKLQSLCRQWKTKTSKFRNKIYGWPRTEEIDLRRAISYGEAGHDAGIWAEITGDMQRASMLLADSPHVKFLEHYCVTGDELFLSQNFKQTAYFKNAIQCVKFTGHYFGQNTVAGINGQARSFVTLFNRIKTHNSLEVQFPSTEGHSSSHTLPVVRATWTPNTIQIDDGMHRLAAFWVLGRRKTTALVFPAQPTMLQALVSQISQTQEHPGLYQPIISPEFDESWRPLRRCEDRLEMMLKFLSSSNHRVSDLSIADLGCSYGWFVAEFLKIGADAVGVDINPSALKIGQIAYGLQAKRVVNENLMDFLGSCGRTYDVVILLSVLHHFALKRDFGNPEELLKRVDGSTGTVLFLDTGQTHEKRYHDTLPEWNNDLIADLILQHTSFDRVITLGTDSDGVGPLSDNYGRTLFACVRS
jgi:SAM-dependent methyltransferase